MKARVVSNFNLITIGNEVIEELKKDIVEYQTKTVAEMKSQAPVDTGVLSNGINGAITNNGLTSTIESPAEYSAYNEFGTYGSVDTNYIAQNDVEQYARSFQRSTDKSRRGTPARRFFFSNARKNFFRLIDNFKP